MLLAPSAESSYILALSAESVMTLGLGSNRWTTGITQQGSSENKAFAKSTEEALHVAVNDGDDFKVQKYSLPLASETSLVASYLLESSATSSISNVAMHISVYHDSALQKDTTAVCATYNEGLNTVIDVWTIETSSVTGAEI